MMRIFKYEFNGFCPIVISIKHLYVEIQLFSLGIKNVIIFLFLYFFLIFFKQMCKTVQNAAENIQFTLNKNHDNNYATYRNNRNSFIISYILKVRYILVLISWWRYRLCIYYLSKAFLLIWNLILKFVDLVKIKVMLLFVWITKIHYTAKYCCNYFRIWRQSAYAFRWKS